MARYSGVRHDEMSDRQKEIAESISNGPRGRLGGLMTLWLHSPEFADRAQRLGAFLRYDTVLPPRLSEMVILITAQHWKCEYEWVIHRPLAETKGLESSIIEAIRTGHLPPFQDPSSASVYNFSTMMLKQQRVSDAAFNDLEHHFGIKGVVETGAIIGHYVNGAITLNAAEFGRPDDVPPPFE